MATLVKSIGISIRSIKLGHSYKKGIIMKYYLLLILSIVTINAQKGKRNIQSLNDPYKKALYTALVKCKDLCRDAQESQYIAKQGAALMQKIAGNIAAKREYSATIFRDDHDHFLQFIVDIKRKVNPSIYEGILEDSLDTVNEAFNTMRERKTKDKRRRLAQKKLGQDSDSFSVEILDEQFDK